MVFVKSDWNGGVRDRIEVRKEGFMKILVDSGKVGGLMKWSYDEVEGFF